MIINKNSWHYKLNNYVFKKMNTGEKYYPAISLCPYFWGTIMRIFQLPFIVLLMGAVVAAFSLWATSFIYSIWFGLYDDGSVVATGLVGGLLSIVIMFAFSSHKYDEAKETYERSVRSDDVKLTPIAVAYSIKNKICPMLEFKDEA